MELDIPNIIINIAEFLSKIGNFISNILLYEFEIGGMTVNMLSMLFVVGVGVWITIILLRLIL